MTSVLRIPGSGNPSSNLKWSMDLGFGMRNLHATVGVLPACLFSLWSLLLCADMLIAPLSNQERDGRPPALL